MNQENERSQQFKRVDLLIASNKELLMLLKREKKARQELLKDVESLEQEVARYRRKVDRFNDVKAELKVEKRVSGNMKNQLEAAWQEIERQNENQASDYLSVV